jgi:hypothetical protein
MDTAKQRWLESRDKSRWAKANMFDARTHRMIWNLQVNSRLNLVLSDKKIEGVESMGGLLLKIVKSPVRAANAAIGMERLSSAAQDSLIRITDPYYVERDQLNSQINREQEALRAARTRPLSNISYEDLENQKLLIQNISSKLSTLEKKLASLPHRNTLPDNLFSQFPSKYDLIRDGFITTDHEKGPQLSEEASNTLPFLTDRGKALKDAILKLSLEIQYILKSGGQISESLITTLHGDAQKAYSECLESS